MKTAHRQTPTIREWTRVAVAATMLSACGSADVLTPESMSPDHETSSEAATSGPNADGSDTGQSNGSEPAAGEPNAALGEEGISTDTTGGGDAGTSSAGGAFVDGMPEQGEKIAGIEFFQRIVGRWLGINSNTPIGFDFPMVVDFTASEDNMVFGQFRLNKTNNVLWGFNIETYNGKDVLAYRNGGYLAGFLRDSRTQLVEHDTEKGFYRFCAVKEHGIPMKAGCNYIEARYTFSGPDRMLFEVTTRSGKPHVHWEATRVQKHTLPNPFPATIASQGDGSAPWPEEAGVGPKK